MQSSAENTLSLDEDTNIDRTDSEFPSAADNDSGQVFNLFRTYLEAKLGTFKKEVVEEANLSSESRFKKANLDSDLYFKFPSNKIQYRFNEDITESLAQIEKSLARNDQKKAELLIQEVRVKLHKRNKLIRLADKSPAGWDTVREYESDDLASDSEDEKKIRKAEQVAIRKRSQTSKQKQRGRFGGRNDFQCPAHSATSSFPAGRMQYFPRGGFQSFRDQFAGSRGSTGSSGSRTIRSPSPWDQCFACSGYGHWRRQCKSTTMPSTTAAGGATN